MELAVGTSGWPTRRVNDARRCHYALSITDVEGTRVGSFVKPGDWCRSMVLLSHSLSNRRLAFTVHQSPSENHAGTFTVLSALPKTHAECSQAIFQSPQRLPTG